jgi:hypothetical protein
MRIGIFLVTFAAAFALGASAACADAPAPRRNPHRPLVTVEPMPEPEADPLERCPVRKQLVEALRAKFGETRLYGYIDSSGTPFETFTSPRGTVTVFFVPRRLVKGTIRACVISTGGSLQTFGRAT